MDSVRFRLASRRFHVSQLPCRHGYVLLALAVALGACGQSSRSAERPHAIVLIVIDTLRADRLSAYGYDGHQTPNIDALAARGVVFEQVHSAAPWTRPAMASMLTSRHPTELGLVETPAENAAPMEWREKRPQLRRSLPERIPTLAELLHAADYETAAFVNQPALGIAGAGFPRGFDVWYSPRELGEIVPLGPDGEIASQGRDLSAAHVNDLALVEGFDRWARTREKRRAFVWLHLLTPHRPYRSWPSAEPLVEGRRLSVSEAYDAEVRAVDEIVGVMWNAVARHFNVERSVVVLTSDHGEEFSEHGMYEHGHSLHGEVLDVPLVVMAPGYPPGGRIAATARTVDILPTLLDLAGEGQAIPNRSAGTSLTPLLAGEPQPRDAYAEAMMYGSTERSLTRGRFKLMYDAQGEQWRLYDRSVDPGERRDVASVEPARVAALRAALERKHARLSASYAEYSGDESAADATLETDTRRALEALGYIESAPAEH